MALRLRGEVFKIEVDEVGAGASCVLDRMEEEMWSLEKPRTMLVALTSVDVVSLEARGSDMSEISLRDSVRANADDSAGVICMLDVGVVVGEETIGATSGSGSDASAGDPTS
jgi:hypothetical protein